MSYQQQYMPPRRKKNPVLLGCGIAAAVGVGLVVILVIVSALAAKKAVDSITPPPTIGTQAATPGKAAPSAKPAAPLKLGQPETGGGIQLTALTVTDHPALSIAATAPKGVLWGVKVKLKNVGSAGFDTNLLLAAFVGSDDQEYQVNLGDLDGQVPTTKLGTGLAVTGWVGVDLPKGVKPTKLEWKDINDNILVVAGLT